MSGGAHSGTLPRKVAGAVVLKKCVVSARFSKITQLLIGIEWGFWSTVLWFGVNFIHHQRKGISLSTSPRAIRTPCNLGQIYSLCDMEGEGLMSPLVSGHFYWFYRTDLQANPVFRPSDRPQRDL